MSIQLKRAYDPLSESDGLRILVERLWPRGVKKSDLKLDEWVKDIAPSTALRKWYNHVPEKWPEFQRRYREELNASPDTIDAFVATIHNQTVTFIYAAKDEKRNSACVLKGYLETQYNIE